MVILFNCIMRLWIPPEHIKTCIIKIFF